MKKAKRFYYVSYYEDFPIYEPAEGGYYYPGTELIDSYKTGSLKSARRLYKKLLAEYELPENGIESGHYIGDSRMLRIETVQGKQERGSVIYQ